MLWSTSIDTETQPSPSMTIKRYEDCWNDSFAVETEATVVDSEEIPHNHDVDRNHVTAQDKMARVVGEDVTNDSWSEAFMDNQMDVSSRCCQMEQAVMEAQCSDGALEGGKDNNHEKIITGDANSIQHHEIQGDDEDDKMSKEKDTWSHFDTDEEETTDDSTMMTDGNIMDPSLNNVLEWMV